MNWSDDSVVHDTVHDVAIICGPTASGKSRLALALAMHLGARVISADSRQIYQDFDIGTAKPSAHDRARVTHHGLDLIPPTERYSAARWYDHARTWLAEARRDAVPAIVVGGTGFYLRTLESPLFASPLRDGPERRDVLEALEQLTTDELRAECTVVDAARAHLGRTQLLRALETHRLTGTPLSRWMHERARPPEFRPRYLALDPGLQLHSQISDRLLQMLAMGWENEVARLAHTVAADAPAWNACGYGAVRDMLAGHLTRPAAVEKTLIETRQYAKRQRTWFRHQLPADRTSRLDPNAPDALEKALEWFHLAAQTEQP
jgi:tRNA dimethylallyltransferase